MSVHSLWRFSVPKRSFLPYASFTSQQQFWTREIESILGFRASNRRSQCHKSIHFHTLASLPFPLPFVSKAIRQHVLSSEFRSKKFTDDPALTQMDVDKRDSIANLVLDDTRCPIGSMTGELIEDAESALLSWAKEYTAIGFERSMQILQRLLQEQQVTQNHHYNHYQDHVYVVRRFLISRVVDCWRICWCENTVQLDPSSMLSLLQDLEGQGATLDNRALTMIIEAMLQKGNPFETPLLAQWILDQRIEEAEDNEILQPDSFLLTSVIRAWAKSGRLEGPEMAEGILDLMHELYNNGWTQSGPNVVSYSAVMDAWSCSERPEAPKAIDKLLDRVKSSTITGLDLDTGIYANSINAWARCGNALGAQKAHERLQEMIQLYENGNDMVVPDASIFARVIFSLATTGNQEMAEQVYQRLQAIYRKTKNPRLQPNAECQKALLCALSRAGTTGRAQKCLNSLIDAAINRKVEMPKRSYFVNLLVATTKEDNPVMAAREAEKILRQMVTLAQAGYKHLMPDSQSFLKVAQAWSRVRDKDAPTRVESLLELMKQTGSPALKPTARLMEVVVSTVCRSWHANPQRAEALINEMELAYANGDSTMKPSRAIYTNLMQAWLRAQQTNDNAVQAIFDKMNILYSQGHTEFQPDAMVYTALMESWVGRGEPGKVQSILDAMVEDYNRGNSLAKPDTYAFNVILKAWSLSDNPNRGAKADATFQKLIGIDNRTGLSLKPDAYTFVYMIRIWCKSDTSNAASKADFYLRSMIDSGFEASFMLYVEVMEAWFRVCNESSNQSIDALLRDLLMAMQSNKVRTPDERGYQQFLKSMQRTDTLTRNPTAQQVLEKMRPRSYRSKSSMKTRE